MSPETNNVEDIKTVATRYRLTIHRSSRGHYIAAERAERRGRILGIASATIGAIVGTSIFATIQSSPSVNWRIATGLLATGAAALGAMQTFLDYAKRAVEHRTAGAEYARLRREFDGLFLELATTDDRVQAIEELSELRHQMDQLGRDSPLVPEQSYKAAEREISKSASQGATD